MGSDEWERDQQLQEEAHAINGILLERRTAASLKISVVGGGRKGPFTLIVDRLEKRQVRQVINAILKEFGENPVEDLA